MDKRAQLADMKQRHAAQVAYGSRSTRLGNQIADLEDELRPLWLRQARFLGFWAFVLAYCGVFWFAIGAGVWQHLFPLIQRMMDQG